MKHINHINEICGVANLPKSSSDVPSNITTNDINSLIRYYYEEYTNVSVDKYKIEDTIIRTNGMEVDNIEGFNDLRSSYSNYSMNVLDKYGGDLDEIWNGDSIIMYFGEDSNKLNIMKSDYFTSRSFKNILYYECAQALIDSDKNLEDISKKMFPARNKILANKNDIMRSDYPAGGGSGGIIFGKQNDEWYILIGKRSQEVNVSKGYYSIVPNGGIEYDHFKEDMSFISTTKREFNEEISPRDGFFENFVDYELLYSGFSLKTGGLSAGHGLFIEDEKAFNELLNQEMNFEFTKLKKINVNNKDEIMEYVNFSNFSPSVIPIVLNGLIRFDERSDYPELPYDVSKVNSNKTE